MRVIERTHEMVVVLRVWQVVIRKAGLEQQSLRRRLAPLDLGHPTVALRIAGRLRRGVVVRRIAVIELAGELLLEVETKLVLLRRLPGEPGHGTVISHQVPECRSAVSELLSRNVGLGVL